MNKWFGTRSDHPDAVGQALLYLLALFCFASASTLLTGVMNSSFFLALPLWACWLWRTRPYCDWRSGIMLLFAGLCLVFAASLAANPQWLGNNLNEFKKDYFKPLLMFMLAASFIRSPAHIRLLLLCFAAGFAVRAWLLLVYYLFDLPVLAPYLRGYALDAVFYFSLSSVLLLHGRLPRRWQWLLAASWLVEALLLVLHQSRSPLLSVLFGLSCLLLAHRAWRKLLWLCGLSLLSAALLLAVKPDLWQRYATTFASASYREDGAVVERKGIWLVTADLITRQPWLGYGPGWRKLSQLAQQPAVLANLGQRKEPRQQAAYFYFTERANRYGKANPHNLYLQLAFETGVPGLALYLGLLLLLLLRARQLLRRPDYQLLASSVLAIVPAFLLVGFANGLSANAVLLMLLAGSAAVVPPDVPFKDDVQ